MDEGDNLRGLSAELIAHHEAAHAVAGCVLGQRFWYVTNLEFNGHPARTEFRNEAPLIDAKFGTPEWPACLDDRCIVLLAGPAAVRFIEPNAADDGGAGDRNEVLKTLEAGYEKNNEQIELQYGRLSHAAARFVRNWWQAISYVARDLMEVRILVEEQVQQTCRSFPGLPDDGEIITIVGIGSGEEDAESFVSKLKESVRDRQNKEQTDGTEHGGRSAGDSDGGGATGGQGEGGE